jgi:hypothetical protein
MAKLFLRAGIQSQAAAARLEWKDIPEETRQQAYALMNEHNQTIDKSIPGFYYIDVSGKYQVFYTLWRYKDIDPRFMSVIKNPVYFCNLSTDMLTAVRKAMEIIPNMAKLELISEDTRHGLIGKTQKEIKFTFGKYRGLSMAKVYLENPSYFAWLNKNADPKYADSPANLAIKFFSDLYFQEVTKKNQETSASQFQGEVGKPITVDVEIYRMDNKVYNEEPIILFKMKDAQDNKFMAYNLDKQMPTIAVGSKIKIRGKVKEHKELLGVKFTAMNYVTILG